MNSSAKNFRVCEAKNLEVGNFIATTQGSRRIVSIRSAGVGKCCDITVFRRENLFGGEPNFILSNGIVSHNCNLSVVSDCVKLVEQVKGKKLERWEIPIDDKDAIRMGSKRDLVGIFQFENPSVRSVVDAVGMDCLDDVSAITSLIRPGPRNMGMDIEYARRKHGEPYTEVEILRKLLVKTHSTMVYQEDTMKISRELAGFTMAEANRLRRACGKKKADVMAGMRALFMKGAQKKIDEGAITQDEVETVWQKIAAFAKYGFCRAHGIAYSALTCAELWLKYHYPVEYITALLNNTHLGKKKFGQELLPSYINYARKRNFVVLGPDINRSQAQFTIEGDDIRFSIGHIKNVANSTPAIVAGQPYQDMADFYERAAVETVTAKGKPSKKRVNKKVVEGLIFAGAFDCFGKREEIIKQYYACRKDKKDVVFEGTEKQWREKEEEAIGVCLSVKPLRWRYAELVKKNHWCAVSDIEDRGRVKVFGRIAHVLAKTSKKGNQMYIVELTDDLDSMKFFVFGGAMTKFINDFKAGYVAAVPLRKFEDSETRFFDVDREGEIVER